ncbi:hypothetical protein N510_001202 [Firmicutes bacterium ASF500]|nr:hypothetical protein N510_001202 [Firmicutes bacterium ASF500]
MNVGGGEAADQMVRMMLSGTEVAVRLSGSALKNLLALTMALAHNRKTLSGKVNMGKMLKETRDLRRFPMTPQQYKQFQKLAKKHKLLFSVIKDKDDRGKLMDVILPVTELDRANAIFERILYTLPPEPERRPAKPLQKGHEVFQPERQAQERSAPEQVQEQQAPAQPKRREQQRKAAVRPQEAPVRPSQPRREVSQRSAEQGRQEAPVTQRQENKGKNGSRSERDSPVIKISSSILKESGTTRGTSERPSIEARLQGYRVQMRRSSASARSKTKTQAKQR